MLAFQRFAAAALMAAACLSLVAKSDYVDQQNVDSLDNSHKVLFVGDGPNPSNTQVRDKIYNFYVDQFRHFQDPRAPYFLLMSKDATLAMGVGGMVRMRGYYDWDGAIPARGFVPSLIQIPSLPSDERNIGATPAGTALFFKVLGRNPKVGDYQLYIEANFSGYDERDFKLKRAYAVINHVTIGYDISTFSDMMSLPPTIDSQGPNAELMNTRVLVRYMCTLRQRWSLAASVEFPEAKIGFQDNTGKVNLWMPDFAAFVQWQTPNMAQHVRLAGIVRTLPYRDLLTQQKHNLVGWGLQLSGAFRPAYNVTLTAAINGGQGYESLIRDLMIDRLDLINDPDRPGRMYAPSAMGWYASFRYNFVPNVYSTLVAGQVHYSPQHSVPGSTYKYGTYLVANVFWDLTQRMQVGAEFNLGQKRERDGADRWAKRVGLMAQFSF